MFSNIIRYRAFSRANLEGFMSYFAKFCLVASFLCAPFTAQASLKIGDFHGNFSNYAYSVGGVSGKSGLSFSSVMQITFDQHGNGRINFISHSTYSGPIGKHLKTFSTVDNDAGHPKIKIKITDAARYVGTMTIYDFPTHGATLHTDFVAIKRNGKVSEIIQNVISNPDGDKAYAALILSKRQSWFHAKKKKKHSSHKREHGHRLADKNKPITSEAKTLPLSDPLQTFGEASIQAPFKAVQ